MEIGSAFPTKVPFCMSLTFKLSIAAGVWASCRSIPPPVSAHSTRWNHPSGSHTSAPGLAPTYSSCNLPNSSSACITLQKPSKTCVYDAGVPLLNHDVIQLLRQARINFKGVCKLLDIRILGQYHVANLQLWQLCTECGLSWAATKDTPSVKIMVLWLRLQLG